MSRGPVCGNGVVDSAGAMGACPVLARRPALHRLPAGVARHHVSRGIQLACNTHTPVRALQASRHGIQAARHKHALAQPQADTPAPAPTSSSSSSTFSSTLAASGAAPPAAAPPLEAAAPPPEGTEASLEVPAAITCAGGGRHGGGRKLVQARAELAAGKWQQAFSDSLIPACCCA